MKKFVFIIGVVALGLYLVGCGKKEASLEDSQVPMSMEALSTLNAETKAAVDSTKVPAALPAEAAKMPAGMQSAAPVIEPKLEPLPPAGPYKPAAREIQTALTNAGFYSGAIDGKIGPKTTKAIEEFQSAKGLKVDGKVGPKTWTALSSYLNLQSAQ